MKIVASVSARGTRRLLLCCWGMVMLLLTLLWPGSANAQEGPLHVPVGKQIAADVATVDRDIVVDGEVLGDVTSWSGAITINGSVSGDVVSYGGPITLGHHAQIGGNVLSLAGGVVADPQAQVAGQLMSDTLIGGRAVAALSSSFGGGQASSRQSIPVLLICLALALVTQLLVIASVLIWPHRTTGAGYTLLALPGRSLLLGLLTTLLLAALLLPLALLLAVTLLGLPLLLLLLLLLQLPYAYGFTVLAQALGSRLRRTPTPQAAFVPTVMAALLLLLPLVLVGFFALTWSAVLFYLLASAGLGALILSRGGVFLPAAVSLVRQV